MESGWSYERDEEIREGLGSVWGSTVDTVCGSSVSGGRRKFGYIRTPENPEWNVYINGSTINVHVKIYVPWLGNRKIRRLTTSTVNDRHT